MGSSKPLSNLCLFTFRFFNLVLADANHSTAATAAPPSDKNSHRCFIPSLAKAASNGDGNHRKRKGRLIEINRKDFIRRAALAMRESGSGNFFVLARFALEATIRDAGAAQSKRP
ncbi:hypothetical protein [Bradyrhizobium genosp. A]|uniref:hypothetical protein n=1 Tax=Bradyrhizobium genosp. A TaxID=83626 RepID=UPI003CEEA3E3